MGSQRIASSLINRPYHPPGWGEPAPGEEPGEGEDGYTNPPLEDGYSELSDGVIVDMQATLRELFDNPDLEMNPESFHLQSLGEAIEFNCSPNSGGEYEGQEGGPGESEYIDPLCACEQSLYWATEAGYDCQTLNVIYFYHPDYLGSVEYVTDMRGEPYQFFLNTPWGENLENQFAKNYTSFSSRFRFNGKERDEETGNFYYGARYYDPKISVWLSVDPLAHEFPGWSPYNFTMNNPLNLVDPDGMAPSDPVWFRAFMGRPEISGRMFNFELLLSARLNIQASVGLSRIAANVGNKRTFIEARYSSDYGNINPFYPEKDGRETDYSYNMVGFAVEVRTPVLNMGLGFIEVEVVDDTENRAVASYTINYYSWGAYESLVVEGQDRSNQEYTEIYEGYSFGGEGQVFLGFSLMYTDYRLIYSSDGKYLPSTIVTAEPVDKDAITKGLKNVSEMPLIWER